MMIFSIIGAATRPPYLDIQPARPVISLKFGRFRIPVCLLLCCVVRHGVASADKTYDGAACCRSTNRIGLSETFFQTAISRRIISVCLKAGQLWIWWAESR